MMPPHSAGSAATLLQAPEKQRHTDLPSTILLEGSFMYCDDIQKLGEQAARKGLTLLDCPYLRAEEMPGHTGEPIALWRNRVSAWEAGWRREVRSRPAASGGPAGYSVVPHRSSAVVLRTN